MATPSLSATTDAPADDLFIMQSAHQDTIISRELREILDTGRAHLVTFFDQPFQESILVQICPNRNAFTATFPPEWGVKETQCWMVATGVADRLTILSPRVWSAEACEHDPDDHQHVKRLVYHELVHVYHGQHNPTRDFVGAEELGWFLEGLAVYVSGQLAEGHAGSAREALALGQGPESLAEAWSGQYRYGVCGSLAQYLDMTCGRTKLTAMLACTSQIQLLAMADLDERELLAGWRDFVRSSE